MAVSVVSFSFFRAAQLEPWSPLCWVLAFLTTPHLPPSSTLLNCLPSVQYVSLILPSNSHVVIWTRLHASAISSDIWRSGCVTSAIFGMARVTTIERKQLSCSSEVTLLRCVRPWEYNGIFLTSSHFIRQIPSTRFPLTTATRMCHFLPVHHLEWHFWLSQKVKT